MHHAPDSSEARWFSGVVNPESRRMVAATGWLLPFAAMLLSLAILTGVAAGFWLLVGGTISGVEVLVAVVVTAVWLAAWLRRIHGERWPLVWISLGVAAGLVILPNLVYGGRVLDDTWDGQWLHQEAVIQLADGWNPFHADLTAGELPNDGGRIRLNGYPKASWLWGASLYRLTHQIERAKAFSLPLLVAAAAMTLAALLAATCLPWRVALPVSILAAANPVALTQLLNAQQDGALASLLTILVSAVLLWLRTDSRLALAVATAAATGVSAIKLTGPLYVGILVAAAVAWAWWKGQARRRVRDLLVATVAGVVGLVLLSGGAYLTNLVRHGHPMYPVLGPDRVVIVDVPPHNRVQALAASLMSRSRSNRSDAETFPFLQSWQGLKLPFTVGRDEVRAFADPNVRIGGWGPLFGGTVLLAAVILVTAGLRSPRWAVMVMVVVAPLVVSVVANPYCWKARYVPQGWLVPLAVGSAALASRSRRAVRWLSWLLVVTTGINVALVSSAHFPATVAHSKYLKERLLELGRRRHELRFDLEPFRSNRVRLAELDIGFEEVADPRFSLPVYLGHSPLTVTDLQVEPAEGGGRLGRLAWQPTPHVDGYLVQVVAPPPAGPGGGVLTVVARRTRVPQAEIRLPASPVRVVVSNCNGIGCGAAGVVEVAAVRVAERRSPLFGVPENGDVARDPVVLFSWLPARSSDGSPARYGFSIHDSASGEPRRQIETDRQWAAERFSEDGEWEARVWLVGSAPEDGDAVVFRSEGVATPRMIAPAPESVHPPGQVMLGWTSLSGVESYEYFVAVAGRPEAAVRGITPSTAVSVDLPVVAGRPTLYVATVRACLEPAGCRIGSEAGWGPWASATGVGEVHFTVATGVDESR